MYEYRLRLTLVPGWHESEKTEDLLRFCLESGILRQIAGIEPDVIWLEDDFRLHNHLPLHWGGCFCEKHMAKFSESLGCRTERADFYKKLLAPGEPTVERKVWLDTARETMASLAGRLGAAVHSVSPSTKVGYADYLQVAD